MKSTEELKGDRQAALEALEKCRGEQAELSAKITERRTMAATGEKNYTEAAKVKDQEALSQVRQTEADLEADLTAITAAIDRVSKAEAGSRVEDIEKELETIRAAGLDILKKFRMGFDALVELSAAAKKLDLRADGLISERANILLDCGESLAIAKTLPLDMTFPIRRSDLAVFCKHWNGSSVDERHVRFKDCDLFLVGKTGAENGSIVGHRKPDQEESPVSIEQEETTIQTGSNA